MPLDHWFAGGRQEQSDPRAEGSLDADVPGWRKDRVCLLPMGCGDNISRPDGHSRKAIQK